MLILLNKENWTFVVDTSRVMYTIEYISYAIEYDIRCSSYNYKLERLSDLRVSKRKDIYRVCARPTP